MAERPKGDDMRDIKFRGVASNDVIGDEGYICKKGDIVYGALCYMGDNPWILGELVDVDSEYTLHEFWIPVEKGSEGQYTGLKDKNGVEIYLGDIVRFDVMAGYAQGEVYQVADGLYCVSGHVLFSRLESAEVLGNIYENPELVEK